MLKRPKNKAISVAISTLCIRAASLRRSYKDRDRHSILRRSLVRNSQVPVAIAARPTKKGPPLEMAAPLLTHLTLTHI
jgi:hypothetical protein